MITIWRWLVLGDWRYFRPGFCIDCRRWGLVFRHRRDADRGRCESCWLDLK